MSLRCMVGTTSAPASTAMSPRATMMPSAAFTIDSRCSSEEMAFLVSILAITRAVEPCDNKIWRRFSMSDADWTKDKAT